MAKYGGVIGKKIIPILKTVWLTKCCPKLAGFTENLGGSDLSYADD
jgi:hypothetical protein